MRARRKAISSKAQPLQDTLRACAAFSALPTSFPAIGQDDRMIGLEDIVIKGDSRITESSAGAIEGYRALTLSGATGVQTPIREVPQTAEAVTREYSRVAARPPSPRRLFKTSSSVEAEASLSEIAAEKTWRDGNRCEQRFPSFIGFSAIFKNEPEL